MTAETIGVFMASGFFMMLLFLRLEAERFGAAEYMEPGGHRGEPGYRGPWTRSSWYLIGAVLLLALFLAHPHPREVLFLRIGNRQGAVLLGLGLAAVGVAQAAGFARLRYGYFRFPAGRAYPSAALNAIGTAVIDEAVFRGVVLGALMAVGMPDGAAIAIATIAYVLATRLLTPGRHWYMPALAAAIGLVCGWATLATGGLGAAVIAHTATSFALFAFTGHAGQIPLSGAEPEDIAGRRANPPGWQDARTPTVAGRGAEPRDFGPAGVSGYGERFAPSEQQGIGRTLGRAQGRAIAALRRLQGVTPPTDSSKGSPRRRR